MTHFAEIENGMVKRVIVAEQDFITSGVLGNPNNWVQTSYNTKGGKHYNPDTSLEDDISPLRKNFAGIGFSYDKIRDAFIPPKPYNSWILDEDSCLWSSPIPYPIDGNYYEWNEELLVWVKID